MIFKTIILSCGALCLSVLPAVAVQEISFLSSKDVSFNSTQPAFVQFLPEKDKEFSLISNKKLILNCNNGSADDCFIQGLLFHSARIEEQKKESPNTDSIDALTFQSLGFFEKACILGNVPSCYYQGLVQEKRKKFDEAVSAYDKACFLGESDACNSAVLLKEEQFGEMWDPNEIKPYWEKGCSLDNGQSCNNLGVLYSNDLLKDNPLIPTNYKKATELFQKACDLGNGFGCINLYKNYKDGQGVAVNLKTAFEAAGKACDLDNGAGCRVLSIQYANGNNGFPKDITQSISLMKQACQLEDEEACRVFKKSPKDKEALCFSKNKKNYCFDAGLAFEKENSDRAMKAYTKGCDLNDGGSCNNLAVLLNKKASKDQKMCVHSEKSDELYKKACDLENGHGCLNFAEILAEKPLKDDNIQTVNAYYEKGCTFESTKACVKLGDNYIKKKGLPRDLKKAADLYEKACDNDNKDGCERIARMYYAGEGRPKDTKKAKDIFLKSCELGDTKNCIIISTQYRYTKTEDIKPQDIQFLNNQCFKNKDANACYILGIWNYQGKGLPRNEVKAQDFFQKSCDYGNYDGCIAKKMFLLPEPLRSLSLPF